MVAALAIAVSLVVYFSAKTWSETGADGPLLPQTGDPIDGRTSISVESLPPLTTMTAASQNPEAIGGPSSSSTLSSSPTSTATSSSTSRTPSPTTSTTTTTTTRPASKEVEYQVVSDTSAVVQYRAASGKAWNYSMEAGTWKIVAPAGGHLEAHTTNGRGTVSCRTQQTRPKRSLAQDRSDDGSVSCAG